MQEHDVGDQTLSGTALQKSEQQSKECVKKKIIKNDFLNRSNIALWEAGHENF